MAPSSTKKTTKKAGAKKPLDASARVAVLHGKEHFLRAEYTAQLRTKLEAEHGEVDTIHFDGREAPPADVLDECRSFGLMQQHKLVVVDEADQFVKESTRPLIERYAQQPAEQATLLLRAEKWNRGKLDQFVEAVGVIIKCDAVSEAQALAWSTRRCAKRHGCTLEPEAARQLVERVGTGLGRIDSELAKLAAAAGDGGSIGQALIDEFVGKSREQEVWDIQAELLVGSPERVLRSLRSMLDVSRHPPVLISYACMDLARKLHTAAHGIRQGVPKGQLMKTLRLWGHSGDLVLGAASAIDPERAADLLDACVQADRAQKSGGGDPERLLERVALRFASLRGS